jgi:hypothetical protein
MLEVSGVRVVDPFPQPSIEGRSNNFAIKPLTRLRRTLPNQLPDCLLPWDDPSMASATSNALRQIFSARAEDMEHSEVDRKHKLILDNFYVNDEKLEILLSERHGADWRDQAGFMIRMQ